MHGRVAAVSTVMALALLGDSLLYVVLPLHGAALGLSGLQVGILLSANRFVRMVTNTAASRLMRRLAPGPLFVAATALAALTTAAYSLGTVFPLFLAARFAWGLSFSALRLGCFLTVLHAAADGTRGRLMGLYQSISRSGSFTAVIAGGALFDLAGYRAAILVMAAGTLLALPLAILRGPLASSPMPEGPRAKVVAPASPGRHRSSFMIHPSRLLAIKWSAFALAFVARGVVTATISLFLLRAFGERFGPGGVIGVATLASWLIGARWVSEIALAAPLGALSDRIGRARSAVGGLLVAASAMSGLALAPAVGVALIAALVLFVAASSLGATLDAAAGDLAPADRRAEVMSSYADWADLGAAAGPLLALTLADHVGLRPTYLLGVALLGSAAVLVLVAFRRQEGVPAPAPLSR